MAALSFDELRAYETDGYVIPSYRVPEHRITVLADALDTVIADNPGVRPERLASIHVTNASGSEVKGHPAFLDIALDVDLVDLVSCVLGDDLIMWGVQAFCKPGGDGMEVPMHQDGQYWPIRPLATCTVWIAIDDSDRTNGCLTVVPGSHRSRIHFHHTVRDDERLVLNQAVDDPRALQRPPVCVELERGQLSMHDVYLVHGSAPNTSGRRRAGLAIRYMPSTSWYRRDIEMPFSGYRVNFATRPIWLVRGTDACGKNDFTLGHTSEPDRLAPGEATFAASERDARARVRPG